MLRFSVQTIISEGRVTQAALDAIKTWLPTSKLPCLPDEFIALFLVSCVNNIEDTQKTILAYFKIKNSAPYLYNDLKMANQDIEEARRVLGICVLPERMENNVAVFCARLLDTNYRKLDMVPVIKYACMTLFMSQMANPPSEAIVVFDLKGIGFMHITCLKMAVVATHLRLIQEGLPLKIRQIHILNTNYVFTRILSLFKMFIKSELLDAFKVHTSGLKLEEFHEKWVPVRCLPVEYGGEAGTFDDLMHKTEADVKDMEEFFEKEEELRKLYVV